MEINAKYQLVCSHNNNATGEHKEQFCSSDRTGRTCHSAYVHYVVIHHNAYLFHFAITFSSKSFALNKASQTAATTTNKEKWTEMKPGFLLLLLQLRGLILYMCCYIRLVSYISTTSRILYTSNIKQN